MNINNNINLQDLAKSKIPKQIFTIIIAFIIGSYILSNSFIYINPGNIGIFINKLNGEINHDPLQPGFKFRLMGFQDIIEYPIFMQTIVLSRSSVEGSQENEEVNVNSIEGQPISCDISLSFELEPAKVPDLYLTFRQDIGKITDGYVKQTIRQVMQQVIGNIEVADFLGKSKSTAVTTVQRELETRLSPYGFVIKQFTINEIRPPESVLLAIEQKNIMAQEALTSKNQLKKVEFEAQHSVAEAMGKAQSILTEAQAQAEANKILSKSISPALVRYKAIEKWSGKMPEVGSIQLPFTNNNIKTK